MWRLFVVSCVAGVLAGCGRGDFALQVQVTAPQGSASRCTKVSATRGADSLESDSATISGGGQVDVLIALDSAAAVTVQAAGYDNVDCMGAPIEQSEQRTGTPTKTAPFPVVVLALAPVAPNTDGGTDAGFDGGFDGGMNDGGMDDGGFDGGTDDGGFDAGTDDAGFDAGTDDAGTDAGLDDAGFDAGTLDAGPECTLSNIGQSCASGSGICNFEGVCIANFPYATSNFDIADLPATDGGVMFVVDNNVTIDTDDGTVLFATAPPRRLVDSDAGYAKLLIIHVDGLTVTAGNTLTVNGANPLIIAVSGDADIAGTITANAGAGPDTLCGSSVGANGGSNTSGSGAGGGGFGSSGGHGGEGYNGGTTSGAGGDVSGEPLLSPLRGGCAGGKGGSNGGPGGAAGGALQLSVSGTLQTSGVISAAGEGGSGGANPGRGGGGGGSGGGVLCEANTLLISSSTKLSANGGGGGGGGGQSGSGGTGESGHVADAMAADGGVGGSGGYTGRRGGAGAALNIAPGGGASGSGGGGGGGGGVGRIRFNANSACINPGAVISPTQTINGGAFAFDAGC